MNSYVAGAAGRPSLRWFLPLFLITGFLPGESTAKARRPAPGEAQEVYSITQARAIPISAKKTKLPLVVYGEEIGSAATYVPSGYMGDAESLKLKSGDFSAPLLSGKQGTTCLKIQIEPKGRERWAGIYWQTPANNWGKIKGAGYDLTAAKRLVFWARGEKGGEKITEIKIGGLVGAYPDTDSVTVGPITLTNQWKPFVVELIGKDLRHIVGGFAFSLRRSDNPRGATFYIDEIVYDGKSSTSTFAAGQGGGPGAMGEEYGMVCSPTLLVPQLTKAIRVTVPFTSVKTAFNQDTTEALDEIAAVAMMYADSGVLVEGHTDNSGTRNVNKKLSLERAQAVADYLESKGVLKDRMSVDGYGDSRPIRENDTEEGREENRRVEVTVVPR